VTPSTPQLPSIVTPPALVVEEPLMPAASTAPLPLDTVPAPAGVTDPAIPTLAETGSDAAAVAPIGAAIVLVGVVLLIARRLVAARADRA